MGRIPIGIKEWKHDPESNMWKLYCSTYHGIELLAYIEPLNESTYKCRLHNQWNLYDTKVLHGTQEEVKKEIEDEIIKTLEKVVEGIKCQLTRYENLIYRFKGGENDC